MPSGLHRGHSSFEGPLVTRVASPPAAGRTQRSPRTETAAWLPSGERETCSPPSVTVRVSSPLLRSSDWTATWISTGFAPATERSSENRRPSFSYATVRRSQAGQGRRAFSSVHEVTALASPPSAGTDQKFMVPFPSPRNHTVDPSAEKQGFSSLRSVFVRRRGVPPAVSTTNRS